MKILKILTILPIYTPMHLVEDDVPAKDIEHPLWSNRSPPPAIGDTVRVSVNSIGDSVVRGYFIEEQYLGVVVAPLQPPEWLRANMGDSDIIHAFGAELSL